MARTTRLQIQQAVDAILRELPRGRVEAPPATPTPPQTVEIVTRQEPMTAKSLQERRRDLWCEAAASVARAETCREPSTACSWADKIVAGFDERVSKGTL